MTDSKAPQFTQPQAGSVQDQFELILKKAIEKHTSDVHLKAGLPPIVRVNGQLYFLSGSGGKSFSYFTSEHLDQFVEILLKPHQLQRYQSGQEVDLGYEIPGMGRFRINICLQKNQPRLVCRYIPDQVQTMEELSIPPVVSSLAMNPRGLILVTGATGSGKTTTLAAMIDHISTQRSCHIITIEDPIEYTFRDKRSVITQREVGTDTQSFVHALKFAMRQDPDVILVGEMRDEETILMALTAAETGHLVLSTLHTVDATETINRILSNVPTERQNQVRLQLASVLQGVISQRLIQTHDGTKRVPVFEILVVNQRAKDLITDPQRTHELRTVIEESQSMGMQTFDQGLMDLVQKGAISEEDALSNCSNPLDFKLRLTGVTTSQGSQWNTQALDPTKQKGASGLEDAPPTARIQINVKDFVDDSGVSDPSLLQKKER